MYPPGVFYCPQVHKLNKTYHALLVCDARLGSRFAICRATTIGRLLAFPRSNSQRCGTFMAHSRSARSVRSWLPSLLEAAGLRSRKQRRVRWPLTLEALETRTVPTLLTAVPQTFTTYPNAPTSLEVLQADSIASGEPVTLAPGGLVSPSWATGPTLTQNADGSLTFTSSNTGTYTFTHSIEGPGGECTAGDPFRRPGRTLWQFLGGARRHRHRRR